MLNISSICINSACYQSLIQTAHSVLNPLINIKADLNKNCKKIGCEDPTKSSQAVSLSIFLCVAPHYL